MCMFVHQAPEESPLRVWLLSLNKTSVYCFVCKAKQKGDSQITEAKRPLIVSSLLVFNICVYTPQEEHQHIPPYLHAETREPAAAAAAAAAVAVAVAVAVAAAVAVAVAAAA